MPKPTPKRTVQVELSATPLEPALIRLLQQRISYTTLRKSCETCTHMLTEQNDMVDRQFGPYCTVFPSLHFPCHEQGSCILHKEPTV